jgi:hypothetical protein
MFNYMFNPDVRERWNAVYRSLREEFVIIGNALIGPNHDLHLRFDAFIDDVLSQMADRARIWGREVVRRTRERLNNGEFGNLPNWQVNEIADTLDAYLIQMYGWVFPGRFPGPYP